MRPISSISVDRDPRRSYDPVQSEIAEIAPETLCMAGVWSRERIRITMANEQPTRGTSRRSILGKGAFATGAALAVAGMPNYRAFAQDTAADGRIKQILDRGKVLIGTGSTNPPWHFEDENGKLVGFDIEMAKILAGGLFGLDQAQILGDEEPRKYIEFVVHEADARIPDLLADKVDINFQFMTVTANRATAGWVHHPVLPRRRRRCCCRRIRNTTRWPISRARARPSRFWPTSPPKI